MAKITSHESSPWAGLGTEQRNERSSELDLLTTPEIVELLIEEDRRGLAAAAACSEDIAVAADWFARTYGSGHRVVFTGAGTSGRLGILEAAECPPTFGTDPERIRAIIAGGPDAVFRSREGAEDREEDGAEAVHDLVAGDLLVGLSASSLTPFVRGSLNQARLQGARTVLITCAAPEGLERAAHLVLALDTGPEILTGSTRLKAGSATKAVLNAISTAAMVRLHKVHGNLMVDLQLSNAKLVDRAARIVAEIAGVAVEEARSVLEGSDDDVKRAVVMARRGVSSEEAADLLAEHDGRLRAVLEPASDDAGSES